MTTTTKGAELEKAFHSKQILYRKKQLDILSLQQDSAKIVKIMEENAVVIEQLSKERSNVLDLNFLLGLFAAYGRKEAERKRFLFSEINLGGLGRMNYKLDQGLINLSLVEEPQLTSTVEYFMKNWSLVKILTNSYKRVFGDDFTISFKVESVSRDEYQGVGTDTIEVVDIVTSYYLICHF
ncbi:MAG: hypothetical protein KBC98_01550 [Candidatus Pacebacteria bacterium]|jgi:hypothetical protein|nr:hypothetical protein [Candidatus Paceibacterota bacterium]